MRVLEYQCDKCGQTRDVVASVKDPIVNPQCHGEMVWTPTSVPEGRFKYTPGKETGVYAYDYGKRATWDLTVPGKMERLRQAGTISDPFADDADDIRSGRKAPYTPSRIENDILEG